MRTRLIPTLTGIVFVVGVSAAAFFTRNTWTDWLASRGFALAFMRRNGYYGDSLVEVNACFYNQKLVETSLRGRAALEFWRARYGRGV